MIVQQGFLIPGVAGTPYCASQCCKYTVNVANFGSDADDDPYYLVGIQTQSGLVTFPGNVEPDMRNFVLLEDAINALGIGTFRVIPIQDDRIQITTEDNPNQLVGIRIRIEGQIHDIPFHECDCHPIPVCEEGVEKCTYYLFRKFETSNDDKIRLKSVKFVNTQPYNAQNPIDTEDYRAIANWLNSLAEADGKMTTTYQNNTLTIEAKSLRYKPEYVVWEVETSIISNGVVTGTQKQNKQTFFIRENCFADCCCCCGGESQPPCQNKNGNNGCNAPLELHLDGLCRPTCQTGWALVAGTWVAAGNAGQPSDCKGQCFGDLVPTNYGCQPKNQKATVCESLAFTVETNPNEKLISIAFGNLGLFKPQNPIILGNGTEVLAWLNAPETGLCPAGTGNCVSVNTEAIPDSNNVLYAFILQHVNLDVSGTKHPIEVTNQFCSSGYKSCVVPRDCEEIDLALTCPHGQTFNINFATCVENTRQNWCAGFTAGAVGAAVPCFEHRPQTSDEYERNKEALITGKIINIQANYNDAVVRWYSTRGLATDYRGYAIHLLIAEGKLPEWEAVCYQTSNGKINI